MASLVLSLLSKYGAGLSTKVVSTVDQLQRMLLAYLGHLASSKAIASTAMLILEDRRQNVSDGSFDTHAPRNTSQSGADADGLGHYFCSTSDREFTQTLRVEETRNIYIHVLLHPRSLFLGV